MKTVRNMRELRLMKQKLSYKGKLFEKEINTSFADVIDDLADKLKEVAFYTGSRLIFSLIKSGRKKQQTDEKVAAE